MKTKIEIAGFIMLVFFCYISLKSETILLKKTQIKYDSRESEGFDIKDVQLKSMLEKIHFQGYIVDSGGIELNGAVMLGCTLWTDSTAGSWVWGNSDSVKVERGIMSVYLDVPYAIIKENSGLYLGLTLDGEDIGRVGLGRVPWSYRSIMSDTSEVSLNTFGIYGNAVSGDMPETGEVLKWDGSCWSPLPDNSDSGFTGGDSYLNNVNDTFGVLAGSEINVDGKIYTLDLLLGDSIMWINKINTDPQFRMNASNYFFYDKQKDREQCYVNFYDGYIKNTGAIITSGIIDSGDLAVYGNATFYKPFNSPIIITPTSGIIDSGRLKCYDEVTFYKQLGIGAAWIENPDPTDSILWNSSGLVIYHGNSFIYDDVTLVGDTLTNNQAYLGLLDVTDSSHIQVRPQMIRSFKNLTTGSRDLDSTYWQLDREGFVLTNYATEGKNDTTVNIKSGYIYAKDSIKLNEGASVIDFIRVGTHAGIVFGGGDTFWLSKDTL